MQNQLAYISESQKVRQIALDTELNQWEDLRITQTMFEDRTLIFDGDENDFIDIIRKKRGSVAIKLEKVEVERHLMAQS